MKKWIALALVLCTVFAFAGCTKKTDKLIIGLDDTFAPMGFRTESGELVGFDIDLARAVAEEMGVEVEFKPIDWKAKEMELESKRIDMVWNGMSKNPEREEKMNLSKPYFNNSFAIMTLASKPIAKKADLAGKTVGTQAGSGALDVIKKDNIYGEIADRLAEYNDYDTAVMDLETGRLDAVIIDKVAGMYKANKEPGKYAFAEEDFGEDLYVIGMRKGDDELTKKVNDALDKVIKSGKAAEISKKWFGEDLLIK